MDRLRNEVVRIKAEIESEFTSRVDQRGLTNELDKWIAGILPEERVTLPLVDSLQPLPLDGRRMRGKTRFGWKDDVKMLWDNTGMTMITA